MYLFVYLFSGYMCGCGSNVKLNEVDEEEELYWILELYEYCWSFLVIDVENVDNFYLFLWYKCEDFYY